MRSVKPQTENDLRWFFGNAPRTAAGDMGLRSNFGSQLEQAREGFASSHGSGTFVDVTGEVTSVVHLSMLRAMEHAARWRGIATRLRAVDASVAILRAHYGERPLGRGLSAAAVHVPAAVAKWQMAYSLALAERGRMPLEVSAFLDRLPQAQLEPIVAAVNVAVRKATFAYEDA